MRRMSTHAGWKEIDRLFEAGTLVGLTDRQLLEQYLGGEAAEASFEALVERHGPMVRAVCRSMIGHRDEADDAFQATFLVLARRAGSIRRRDAVGSWLYGVACRVAARAPCRRRTSGVLQRFLARAGTPRVRPGRNRRASPCPSCWKRSSGCPSAIGRRWCSAIWKAGPTTRPPGSWVVRCGRSQTRLQRGKAKLRTRLVRRGLAPAAGLLAIGVESPSRPDRSRPRSGRDRIDGSGIGAIRRRPRRRARLDRCWPGPGRACGHYSGTGSGARRGGCSHYLWVWP